MMTTTALPPPEVHDPDDAGYSLLEILVSLALMGTVMAAVMAALFSAIHASSVSDNASDLDAVLGAAGDGLGDALFVACPEDVSPNAYEQYADAGAAAVGWPADAVQVVDVKYWDPTVPSGANAWVESNGINGGECDQAVWLSSAKAMQKVSVRATTADGSSTRTIEIVITDMRPEN